MPLFFSVSRTPKHPLFFGVRRHPAPAPSFADSMPRAGQNIWRKQPPGKIGVIPPRRSGGANTGRPAQNRRRGLFRRQLEDFSALQPCPERSRSPLEFLKGAPPKTVAGSRAGNPQAVLLFKAAPYRRGGGRQKGSVLSPLKGRSKCGAAAGRLSGSRLYPATSAAALAAMPKMPKPSLTQRKGAARAAPLFRCETIPLRKSPATPSFPPSPSPPLPLRGPPKGVLPQRRRYGRSAAFGPPRFSPRRGPAAICAAGAAG